MNAPTSLRTAGLALIGVMLWAVCFARADEPKAAPSEPTSLRQMIDSWIEQCQVFVSAEAEEPATPLVALRWANNARGSEDGLTMLYIHEGRPIAAACLYPWAGRLVHDFEAISRDRIVARKDGAVVWQPHELGVTFADIPDAEPPASTAGQRLRQMKSLAAEFQATLVGWKRDNSDREELRLLTRPLYRYETKGPPIIDGAVFAFAMGTDPEVLLLVEAVRQDGIARWQYGFARRTSGELEGRHREKIVWTATRYPETKNPQKPHFSLSAPIPPELLPTSPH
jgi:hypothetical protein